ncbi:GATA zinc finger domain-containing protein 15 [Eurytemora carolleeae]|uniref:GATA zinc finger domain-containing protein 15 n=1 Tax=Eurytemora carolleeae TaxID=1294199 RepID=UPI000C7747D1|nr:GATA zinc finger domain-containing protein 15 [Eurytemora carolleeae]|eukprot:XP_023349347.1 GATA zinc finger domain-containing protein 15-like [Eurytemora affinis]
MLNKVENNIECLLNKHLEIINLQSRKKRSETVPITQTVYQYQKKAKKCKNVQSSGIASGSNSLSYMSFVAAIITLVLNINNNINANNNNNNLVNLNLGNNNNVVTNLNQNVGNNFNLMFPPGKRRKRRNVKKNGKIRVKKSLIRMRNHSDQCTLHTPSFMQ